MEPLRDLPSFVWTPWNRNISTNQLTTLPPDTLSPTLELLDVSLNKLKALPADLVQLQALKELYLHGNAFLAFPDQVFQLAALEVLTLDSPKLTGVAFTTDQAAFLAKLGNFSINADALATTCDTAVQVHAYSVCVTTAAPVMGSREHAHSTSPTVYVLVAVGSLCVVAAAVGAVVRQRRRTAMNQSELPWSHASAGDGRGSVTDKRMFIVDDLESDSILESPVRRIDMGTGVGDYVTTSSKLSSHASFGSSTSGSRRFVSVWDDEELLRWRVDAAQIHDVELLGTGFFGDVWLARYLGGFVAVKRLKKRPAEPLVRAEIQQFIAEIRLVARLSHPKIVSFVGVAWTMESDIQALVEYMARGDLCSYMTTTRSSVASEATHDDSASFWGPTTLQIATDVAEALVYLHSLSPLVLHRDLKSRNVLLSDGLCAKLTDFGGSRVQSEDASTQTAGVGTARWTAPEVLVGNGRYSEAVDIYSFGVILSELDTFRIPYTEFADIPEACLLSRVASGEVQPAFSVNAAADLVTLARQCLALDPSVRPSAVQVAYQLRQIAASAGSNHRSTSDSYLSTASPSSVRSVACADNNVGML